MDVWVFIFRDGCMSVKIRVSIPVTVRSQDPKPIKNQLISYCNTVRVPAQKRSPPARSARLYFFSGDGKPPWLGGPKAHSPHDMFIHAGFEAHGNRTSPHHPVGLLRSPRQRWLRCDYMGRPLCKSACVDKWLCVKALVCKAVCV